MSNNCSSELAIEEFSARFRVAYLSSDLRNDCSNRKSGMVIAEVFMVVDEFAGLFYTRLRSGEVIKGEKCRDREGDMKEERNEEREI